MNIPTHLTIHLPSSYLWSYNLHISYVLPTYLPIYPPIDLPTYLPTYLLISYFLFPTYLPTHFPPTSYNLNSYRFYLLTILQPTY